MRILDALKQSIGKVGIKEVARRTGLSPSTVSRVHSGLISPSFEVVEKISDAIGFVLKLQTDSGASQAPRLEFAKSVLGRLRNELKILGVRHAIIFGSVARGEDKMNSDIDVYLEFSGKFSIVKQLKAEGRIIEAFGKTKADVVSRLESAKGQKLMLQIEKDGHRVF